MDDGDSRDRPRPVPFSWNWVWVCGFTFLGLELVAGDLVGGYVLAHYVGEPWAESLSIALTLVAYFLGGVALGVVSPRFRPVESALGALGALVMGYQVARWSTPSPGGFEIAVAGLFAFLLALLGAGLGERWARLVVISERRGRVLITTGSDERPQAR